jgi:dTMP kinase
MNIAMRNRIYIFLICAITTPLLSETMSINRGFLFSIEGTEGCGKSTLITKLAQKLSDEQYDIVTTREPGATELGKNLRALLMNKTAKTCTLAEFLLFAADRSQHFQEIIMPSLAQNKIVICDRMADSSLVYQGHVKGLDQSKMMFVNQWAMQDQQPDIVFYLRIDSETAMARVQQRNKNLNEESVPFEKEILEKKQQLIDGFDAILKDRANVIILDATASADEIAEQAFNAIIRFIQKDNE